jgi:hypothetical protein
MKMTCFYALFLIRKFLWECENFWVWLEVGKDECFRCRFCRHSAHCNETFTETENRIICTNRLTHIFFSFSSSSSSYQVIYRIYEGGGWRLEYTQILWMFRRRTKKVFFFCENLSRASDEFKIHKKKCYKF